MYEWVDVAELDRLREMKEALRMERKAWAECHQHRMAVVSKLVRIKKLLRDHDARSDQGG